MSKISKKQLEATKNHHQVWANYMKRWSPDNLSVFYTTKKGNIGYDSVRNVAVERHFYRVEHLEEEHLEVIKSISKYSDKSLQELHMSYLSDYLRKQHYSTLYDNSGVKDDVADKIIEAWKCNGIEDSYTKHEGECKHILESLAARDLSVLEDDDNMMKFTLFYAHQMARTKTFKDTIIEGASRLNKQTNPLTSNKIEECWWFIAYMLGMNIGKSLFLDRKTDTHCLLINDSQTPFITSDQPIINVYQSFHYEEVRPPEGHECDLYYPISPSVAYMINKSDRFPSGFVNVGLDVVEEMNLKIARKANVHIISNSEESLKPYRKNVGEWFDIVRKI
ncbi:DUF4238 domain-containing protein [Vibrio parahaemolyticus]|nr:DUF4238 domain-containing protein [Vibrio parahaemolyticus]